METKSKLIEWTARTHRVWGGLTNGTPKRWYGIRQFSIGLSAFYGIASPEVVSDEYTTEDNFPISGNYVTLAEAKDACEKIEFERLLTGQTIREALNPIYAEIKDAMDASIEKYVLPKPPEPATEPEPVNAEWKHISGSVWELLQGVKDYYCLEKIASVDDRRAVWEAYETDNKNNKEIYKGTFRNLKDAQFNAVHGMPLSYPTIIEPEATREPAAKPPETSAAELIWTEIPYGEKCVAKFHKFIIARESDDHFTLKHRRHSEANFIFVEGLLSMKAAKEVARLMEKVEYGNAAIRAANAESVPAAQKLNATWNNPPENIKADFTQQIQGTMNPLPKLPWYMVNSDGTALDCMTRFHKFEIKPTANGEYVLRWYERNSKEIFEENHGTNPSQAKRRAEEIDYEAWLRADKQKQDTQPAEAKPKLILRFKDGRKPVNITNADRFEIGFQTDAVFLYLGADQQAVHAYKWSEMESISRVV